MSIILPENQHSSHLSFKEKKKNVQIQCKGFPFWLANQILTRASRSIPQLEFKQIDVYLTHRFVLVFRIHLFLVVKLQLMHFFPYKLYINTFLPNIPIYLDIDNILIFLFFYSKEKLRESLIFKMTLFCALFET